MGNENNEGQFANGNGDNHEEGEENAEGGESDGKTFGKKEEILLDA
jgi:hypothetical protein